MALSLPIVNVGVDICLDVNFRTISSAKRKLTFKLNPKEYELLVYFMDHAGQIISRNQILDSVWGMAALVRTNSIDVYISSLRKKLKILCNFSCIETIHGAGFVFSLPKSPLGNR